MTGSFTNPNDPRLAQFEPMLPEALEDAKNPAEHLVTFDAIKACGMPTRKMEAWKYTDISAAVSGPFKRPHAGAFGLLIPKPVQARLITTFPPVERDQPFALLSRALSHSGIEITVPPGTVLDELIEIDLPVAKANVLFCPALVVRVGAGSRVHFLVRSDRQGDNSLLSWLAQITVEENASVSFTKIRTGSGANFCHLQTRQAAGSRLELFDAVIGGALTRNDLTAELNGSGAEVHLNGLYAVSGTDHVDNHTTIQHAVPDTRSRQLYKGILNDHACGVFNGRIVVQPGAQRSDAHQLNRNLLRSRTAKIFTKPQLEIANDDVRCSHGAAIGRLDPAQIFYLESRGLNRTAAEALLARGFAADVIDLIPSVPARETLHQLTQDFFSRSEPEDAS